MAPLFGLSVARCSEQAKKTRLAQWVGASGDGEGVGELSEPVGEVDARYLQVSEL